MKKVLLIFIGFGCVIYSQQKPSFGITLSQYTKPAYWARPKTVSYIYLDNEQIPKGYVPFVTLSSGKVVEARKRLPISGKHEFWNKFISGYGQDEEVEKELRSNYLVFKGLRNQLSSEELDERAKTNREEKRFLKNIEKETSSHYVSPRYIKPKPTTGPFSGWRNWWNNLWKPRTPSYTAPRPISVPINKTSSE